MPRGTAPFGIAMVMFVVFATMHFGEYRTRAEEQKPVKGEKYSREDFLNLLRAYEEGRR